MSKVIPIFCGFTLYFFSLLFFIHFVAMLLAFFSDAREETRGTMQVRVLLRAVSSQDNIIEQLY